MSHLFNPAYFRKETVLQMQKQFVTSGQLLLGNFLSETYFETLLKQITKSKWTHYYVPDQFSYHAIQTKIPDDVLTQYVSFIAGPVKHIGTHVMGFGHKDYTILHDDPGQDIIECVISLTPYDARWGGRLIYRTMEGEATIILPQPNQFTLMRTKQCRKYLEYVNHHAKNNHIILVVLQFQKNKR